MASGPSRMQVLSIYKSLLREANKLPNYNFRSYAIRRVRDAFADNRNVTDSRQAKKLLESARENLEILRRQVVIQHLYQSEKLIIENKST